MSLPLRWAAFLGCLLVSACDIRDDRGRNQDTGVAIRPDAGRLDLGLIDAGSVDVGAPDSGFGLDSGTAPPVNILVDRVLDGDTIIVAAGDIRTPDGRLLDGERIRFIGIDTPEIAHDPDPADCYGDEAAAFTRQRLEGRFITLEYDLENGLRDVFDRVLAYVSVNGEVLNETLLRDGYARVFRRFSFRERSSYLAIEAEARQRGVGLWSACP